MIRLLCLAVLPEHFMQAFTAEVVGALVMGLLSLLLFVGGFKLFERATPTLDIEKRLNDSPMATAVVVSSMFISIALVMAVIFSGR